jgi:hypothetical protein
VIDPKKSNGRLAVFVCARVGVVQIGERSPLSELCGRVLGAFERERHTI